MIAIEQLLLHLKSNGIRVTLNDGKLQVHAGKGKLSDELKQQLKSNKEHLVKYLSKNNIDSKKAVTAVERNEQSPLSFSQQRLWFIDQLQGGASEYNMPMAFEVKGPLNLSLVSTVFSHIIERHEILRTVYVESQGETTQCIRPMSDIDFQINEIDLKHLTRETKSDAVATFVERDTLTPFNLATDVMLRVSYVHTDLDSGVLIFNMHHIASDGWSMEVLTKEFFVLYDAFSQGKPSPLPALEIQYADYAQWQHTHLKGEVLDNQLDYWVKQLDDVPPLHDLPLSHTRPEMKAHEGALVSGQLSATVSQKLQALAKQFQLTPFMLLHGALSLLLAKHSNNPDVVIGTPIANRTQLELKPLIGFFVNTLVLRTDTRHATLSDYFAHIKQVHLGAQSNQDVPFEQLVERLNIPRSTMHTPLFQILLTTNTDFGMNTGSSHDVMALSGVTLAGYQSEMVQAKFDLDINLQVSQDGIGIIWTYDISLFDEVVISKLNNHLCRLLTELSDITKGETSPHTLAMLSKEEEGYLVKELNDTVNNNYPTDLFIHELFEQQVLEHADAIALEYDDEQLTYRELNTRANQLAHYLISQGVQVEQSVGICLPRSVDMVISVLAVLKAGATYIPLDPDYPSARIGHIFEDTNLGHLVTHSNLVSGLPTDGVTLYESDKLRDILRGYPTTNITRRVGHNRSSLAYMIFTSGSTGKPKGVMIEHQALVNHIAGMADKLSGAFSWPNKLLAVTTVAFDIAGLELLGPLAYGGQVVLSTSDEAKEPSKLSSLLTSKQITCMQATPATWQMLVEDGWSGSAELVALTGGEALPLNLAQALLPRVHQLWNCYGPTEATIWSLVNQVDRQQVESGQIVLGGPLGNYSHYVLNEHGQVQPIGCVGELYIGGIGLARGYLNRADMTSRVFIENPFSEFDGSQKLYKTGDLVCVRDNGEIEYHGRVDHQVKIRGFRIELADVESQISVVKGVDNALVVATELAGSQQLVGYVKPCNVQGESEEAELLYDVKQCLSRQLPDYMVPSVLMMVSNWPLTPNG
ncbi:amino acid adenylation domain-containing protein, partial [Pseudoalteromonas luteoviolacea]